jgi:hypothetical protein
MERKVEERFEIEQQQQLKKIIFLTELKLCELNSGEKIYNNQYNTANEIIDNFIKNACIVIQLVIALTQSGKSGVKIALIKLLLERNIVNMDNIYIITGLSSIDWKNQMRNRIPSCIKDNIFHGGELSKAFIDNLKNKKNVVIIMDEIHVASKPQQRIYKCFKEIGFYNKDFLLQNDIKIVEFDATPDGTLYNLMEMEEHSKLVKLKAGDGYTSCFKLLENNQLRQYLDLECYNKADNKVDIERFNENVKSLISDIQSYSSAKYHIIRCPVGKRQQYVLKNLKTVFNPKYYNYILLDQENALQDIDILSKEPEKHTFILIKEKLKCSITYKSKKFLGVSYDRISNNDSLLIQSLVGRITGYTTYNYNICYTNIDTIERYKKLYDSDFKDRTIYWKSLTTQMIGKKLSAKDTFNSNKFIQLNAKENVDEKKQNKNDVEVIIFNTQKELIDYHYERVSVKLKYNEPDKDGYYKTTLGNKKVKVLSLNELLNNYSTILGGLSQKFGFRRCVCYEDVSNKDSIKFVSLYYKNYNKLKEAK